jgi:hypothetical protein
MHYESAAPRVETSGALVRTRQFRAIVLERGIRPTALIDPIA